MINEVIFRNRDNVIWLGLRINKQLVNIAEITKVELVFKDQTFSSEILGHGEDYPFDWTQKKGIGVLILRLGQLELLKGVYIVKLVVYSTTNKNGLIWDYIRLRVKD